METTRQILRGVKPEEELEKVHSSFRELWLSTAPEHDSPAWYIAMAFEVEMKTLREVDPQVSTYYQAREKHSEAVLRYQRAYSGPNPDYTETIGKMEAAQKDQMKYRAIADDVKDGALGVEWRALHGRATELANVSWGWLTGYSSKDVDAKYRRQLGYEISVAENRIRRRISDVAETTHSLVSKS